MKASKTLTAIIPHIRTFLLQRLDNRKIEEIMPNLQSPLALPEAMRARDQWVMWRLEPVPGRTKPAKVPYTPGGSLRAKAGVPSTWGSFERAMRSLRISHEFFDEHGGCGVGYQFDSGDPFTFVDIDSCTDNDGAILPDIQDLVLASRSFAEYSVSGKGVHVFVEAKLPPRKNPASGGFEGYDAQRFCACTGLVFPGAAGDVAKNQIWVDQFCATYLPLPPTPMKTVRTAYTAPQGGYNGLAGGYSGWTMAEFISRHGIAARGPIPYSGGGEVAD